MQYVGADPAFIKLCRAQRSFRARLTPKPWRIGQSQPPIQFPRETPRDEERFHRWLSGYESASADWATCRLLEAGINNVHEKIQPLLTLHDESTKATTALPLA